MHRYRFATLILLMLACEISWAHQLVLSTGYANSRTPETGDDVDINNAPFAAGGGYAVGVRVDLKSPRAPLFFGPSFLFWNNVTGDPDPNANANYFQIELGGRISLRTRTVPTLYAGAGLGYTMAHGETIAKLDGSRTEYDGDFPTTSLHFGFKTQSREGLGFLGEGSYHFGLASATGHHAAGPAKAWLIQIGVVLDILSSRQR